MVQNILVTGAAGFIGGSVLADLISTPSSLIKKANISAAVRSQEQVQSLSKLGVNVIQLDLSNETAVNEAVLGNEIDIVVHTASSIDSHLTSHLIKALGQRRKISGEETCIIHSSVITVFTPEAGWLSGEVKDIDPLFEQEKQMGGSHPVRQNNILVAELAGAHGVKNLNLLLPSVYGIGTGEWRKLSVFLPAVIRASIKHKIVYKFDVDGSPASAHVSDVAALYTIFVNKVLQQEPILSGEKGYYFVMSHKGHWWATLERLAEALHARGLVNDPKVQVWPSDKIAAEYLGFPLLYVRAMGTYSGQLVPVKAYQVGWQPKWDEERYLESMDEEIQAVLELDTVKATVFDSLIPTSK